MPVTKALYTEAKYVFQNTILSGDIDEDKIIPYIKRAQELYIFEWLGQRLYEHMDDLINNEEIDDAGNEAYLLLAQEYIAPAVDYYAAAEFLKYGGFSVSDNGVYKKNANNATPATEAEKGKLIDMLMNVAENKRSIFYDFICNNQGDYPEYYTVESQQRPPSHVTYSKPFI